MLRRFLPNATDIVTWWGTVIIAVAGTNSTRVAFMVTLSYWGGWIVSRFQKEKKSNG